MKFCTMCGKEADDNALFCMYCGNRFKVDGGVSDQSQSETNTVTQTEVKEKVPQSKETETRPDKNILKPEKRTMTVAEKIGTVIVCALLLVVLLVGALAGVVKNTVSEKSIAKIIDEIDIADITVEQILDIDDDKTLAEYIYENMDEASVSEYDISEKEVAELLEEDAIKEFITDTLSDYCYYICYGGNVPKITSEDLIEFIEDNEDKIFEITGYELSDEDYAYIEELEDSGQLDALDVSVLEDNEEISEMLATLRTFLSTGFFFTLIIIALLLCIAIFFLCRKDLFNSSCCVGIVALLAGISLMIVSAIVANLTSLISNALTLPTEIVKPVIAYINTCIRQSMYVFLIIGGVVVIARIVVYFAKTRCLVTENNDGANSNWNSYKRAIIATYAVGLVVIALGLVLVISSDRMSYVENETGEISENGTEELVENGELENESDETEEITYSESDMNIDAEEEAETVIKIGNTLTTDYYEVTLTSICYANATVIPTEEQANILSTDSENFLVPMSYKEADSFSEAGYEILKATDGYCLLCFSFDYKFIGKEDTDYPSYFGANVSLSYLDYTFSDSSYIAHRIISDEEVDEWHSFTSTSTINRSVAFYNASSQHHPFEEYTMEARGFIAIPDDVMEDDDAILNLRIYESWSNFDITVCVDSHDFANRLS